MEVLQVLLRLVSSSPQSTMSHEGIGNRVDTQTLITANVINFSLIQKYGETKNKMKSIYFLPFYNV